MAFRSGFQILCQVPKKNLASNCPRKFSAEKAPKLVDIPTSYTENSARDKLSNSPKWFSSIKHCKSGSDGPSKPTNTSSFGPWFSYERIGKLMLCHEQLKRKPLEPEHLPYSVDNRRIQKPTGDALLFKQRQPGDISSEPKDAPPFPSVDAMPPFTSLLEGSLAVQQPDYSRLMCSNVHTDRNRKCALQECKTPETIDLMSPYRSVVHHTIDLVDGRKPFFSKNEHVHDTENASWLSPNIDLLDGQLPIVSKCPPRKTLNMPSYLSRAMGIRHFHNQARKNYKLAVGRALKIPIVKIPKSFQLLRENSICQDRRSLVSTQKYMNMNGSPSVKQLKTGKAFGKNVMRYYRQKMYDQAKLVRSPSLYTVNKRFYRTSSKNNSNSVYKISNVRRIAHANIHTSSSPLPKEIKQCPKPPPPKEPCGYLKKPEVKKYPRAIDAKDEKCKPKYWSPPPPRGKCGKCEKICLPSCKEPDRVICCEEEEPPPCKKILTPTPAYSECRCGPVPPHLKCLECFPKVMSCPQRRKDDITCSTPKNPIKLKIHCARREVPPQKPWDQIPACKKVVPCAQPYRADEHSPPKKWKPLAPIFPVQKKNFSCGYHNLRQFCTHCSNCKNIKPKTCAHQDKPIDPVIAYERYKTEGSVTCRKVVAPAKGSCEKWASKGRNRKNRNKCFFSTATRACVDGPSISRAFSTLPVTTLLAETSDLSVKQLLPIACTLIRPMTTCGMDKQAWTKKDFNPPEKKTPTIFKNFRDKTIEDLRLQTEGECKRKCMKLRMPMPYCEPPLQRELCVPKLEYFPCTKTEAPHPSYSECKEDDEPKDFNDCMDCPISITPTKIYVKPGCLCYDTATNVDPTPKGNCPILKETPFDKNQSCWKRKCYSTSTNAVANLIRVKLNSSQNTSLSNSHRTYCTTAKNIKRNPMEEKDNKTQQTVQNTLFQKLFYSVDKNLQPGNRFLGPRRKLDVPTARKVDPLREEQCLYKKCRQLQEEDPDYGTPDCEKTPFCDTPENREKFCHEQRRITIGCTDPPNSPGRVCRSKPPKKKTKTPCFSTSAKFSHHHPAAKQRTTPVLSCHPTKRWLSSSSFLRQKSNGCCTNSRPNMCNGNLPTDDGPSFLGLSKLFNKVADFFRARPNCPHPSDYKKQQLMIKAKEAAKAVGMELCPIPPIKTKRPCKFALEPPKEVVRKVSCMKIKMPGCSPPCERPMCSSEPEAPPRCVALSPPYPSFSELRRFEFPRKKINECNVVDEAKWNKLNDSANFRQLPPKDPQICQAARPLPSFTEKAGTLEQLLSDMAETCETCGGTGTVQIAKKSALNENRSLEFKKWKTQKQTVGTVNTLNMAVGMPGPTVKIKRMKKIRSSKNAKFRKAQTCVLPMCSGARTAEVQRDCCRNYTRSAVYLRGKQTDGGCPPGKPPAAKKPKCSKICCPGCPPPAERPQCLPEEYVYPPCKPIPVPYESFTEKKTFEFARKPLTECSIVSDIEYNNLANSMQILSEKRAAKKKAESGESDDGESKGVCGCGCKKSKCTCGRKFSTSAVRFYCEGKDKKNNPHELGADCKKSKFIPSDVDLKPGEIQEICKPIEIEVKPPKKAAKCKPPVPKPKPKPRCGLPHGPPEDLTDKCKRVRNCCPQPPPPTYGPCDEDSRCFSTVPQPMPSASGRPEPSFYNTLPTSTATTTEMKSVPQIQQCALEMYAKASRKRKHTHVHVPHKKIRSNSQEVHVLAKKFHLKEVPAKPFVYSRTIKWGELNAKGQKLFDE